MGPISIVVISFISAGIAIKLGYKIYYTPYAKLWHKVGMTTGGSDSPLRYFNSIRSEILLVKKHGTNKQFGKYIFRRFFYFTPKFVGTNLFKKRLDLVFAYTKGFISGLILVIKSP